jgi:hypothetical protein
MTMGALTKGKEPEGDPERKGVTPYPRSRPSKEYRSRACSSASLASCIFRSFFYRERRIWRASNILLKFMECLELEVRARDLVR